MPGYKTLKEKYNLETGFFKQGLPYTKIGNKKDIIIDIEALSFKHEPASGLELKQIIRSHRLLAEEFSVYLIGRKPNLPEDYLMDKMALDYARLIKEEFGFPVNIMGISTGGQIAQYLAADYPDTVKKLAIISSAYRLSEKGVEIEGRSAEYFKKKQYGKSLAVLMDFALKPGLKTCMIKIFLKLLGRKKLGKIEYPNDFLTEIKADREMNFKDRLHEIKAPTLIISGELDIAYTSNDVRVTADKTPNSKLILYPEYGHNLSFSNTDRVQIDLLSFFRNL